MTRSQKIQLKLSETRQKLGKMLDTETEQRSETWSADLDTVKNELRSLETELQAAILIEPEETDTSATETETKEDKEVRELRETVDFGNYIRAALAHGPVQNGAELELNQHLGIAADYFPMEILARDLDEDLETRAAVDGDAGANQASWIERVFSGTAARALGVTMPSVAPGIAAYPVLGSTAAPAQRQRAEAVAEATITASVTEIKPSRNSVRAVYSIEDSARLPGFSDAIKRDLRNAVTEKIDRTIFVGDSQAGGTEADIAGFTTAGVNEVTLKQSEKVKADDVIKLLAGLIDGKYAASMSDLNVVATVGSNQLWLGTIHNSVASNETIAQFLRASGVSWVTRGDIETNTADGDFGAFIGLKRGITNAAVAPVWSAAKLITDPYTGAGKGEIALTLQYLWGFKVPRVANFRRLKYVT